MVWRCPEYDTHPPKLERIELFTKLLFTIEQKCLASRENEGTAVAEVVAVAVVVAEEVTTGENI